MKKIMVFILGLVLLLSGCRPKPSPTGSINITFHFSESLSVQTINYDLSQVENGEVFLKQSGVTQFQADLILDLANKTGSCNFTDTRVGSYDILVELYDSNGLVLYQGQDEVTINAGNNETKNISLDKNIAKLTITGSWSEDVSDLMTAIVRLKKDSTIKYAGNLVLNLDNKSVSGGINGIYPDTYEVYIEIKNSEGMVLFSGSQTTNITIGDNGVTVSLILKTGSIGINLNGDFTAPVISSGPSMSEVGQDVVITWTTNENATSEVCYSTTPGFDYLTETNWAPVGRDLTADNTSHSVTISGLDYINYYYVVVSTDNSGNTVVSDEKILNQYIVISGYAFFENYEARRYSNVTFDNCDIVVKGSMKIKTAGKIILTSTAHIRCFNSSLIYFGEGQLYTQLWLYNDYGPARVRDNDGYYGGTLYGSGGGGGGGSLFLSGAYGGNSSDGGPGGAPGDVITFNSTEFQGVEGGNGGDGCGIAGCSGVGGGVISLIADSVDVSGVISAKGYDGGAGAYDDGGGGGGSAGELFIKAKEIKFSNSSMVELYGGLGGSGGSYESWTGGSGGNGANSNIKLKCETVQLGTDTFGWSEGNNINTYIANNFSSNILLVNPSTTGMTSGQVFCTEY
jgi:hypothetical protein